MATNDDIAGTLRSIGIGSGVQPVEPDTELFDSGLLDSLGMISLIDRLESDYRIKIADEDLLPDNFGTIESIAQYVSDRQDPS